jgi:hypothetical protein
VRGKRGRWHKRKHDRGSYHIYRCSKGHNIARYYHDDEAPAHTVGPCTGGIESGPSRCGRLLVLDPDARPLLAPQGAR